MAPLHALHALGQPVAAHRPWPRSRIGAEVWGRIGSELAAGRLDLIGLWGEPAAVHVAVMDHGEPPGIGVFSLDCPDGAFPSIGRVHPPAIRLERTAQDLFGLRAAGLPDQRAWLDHGAWGVAAPLAEPARAASAAAEYAFLPVEGEDLHEIPVGPVHAGIIEPGHFRFTADGETVVRLEERLGYTHKGQESLLQGASIGHAARLAGRVSGDSTVAYADAFARAVEAALQVDVPARALALRALMGELERIANHLGDFGAICNDAAFALMLAHCAILRELVLRAAGGCFGHRLMMDRIVPGGVTADLGADGEARLRALLTEIRLRLPPLVALYGNTASLQNRTIATGAISPDMVRQFAAGGFVGRASGRAFDARKALAYPPYDRLDFDVPALREGDVNARVLIRLAEIGQSLRLIDQLLGTLPAGPILVELPGADSAIHEGMAITEAFRGDVLAWLRIGTDGRIARCHLRDASWFQWPLLEVAVYGNIVADFPLCNKSFNCSYSGHDL